MPRFPLRTTWYPILGMAFVVAMLLPERAVHAQKGGNGAPTISVTPGAGEYAVGQQVSLTVTYCDNGGLNANTQILRFNNEDLLNWPVTYTTGNPGSCLARGVASGIVVIQPGTNVVRASIEDNTGLWSGWSITEYTTPQPWTGLSVRAMNRFQSASPGESRWYQFLVSNPADAPATVTFTASNVGLAGVGAPSPASATIAAGGVQTVSVQATASWTNLASGRVYLKATSGPDADSAWAEIASEQPAPIVDGVTLVNPTGVIARDLCLTVAAGASAAVNCGDLQLDYTLPGVVARTKAIAPSLVYNSATAHPWAHIAADVALSNPAAAGELLTAHLVITGGPKAGQVFHAGGWHVSVYGGVAGRRRIVASIDAQTFPTDRYPFRLDILTSSGTVYSSTGELLVVNRSNSPFGAGWWLGGFEQLVFPSSGGGIMWVGGDGSARMYRPGSAACTWVADALARPDSMVATWNGSACVNHVRKLPNARRVTYDGAGRHLQTINRVNETTSFIHDAGSGRLNAVVIPSGSLARSYDFAYTGGVLDSVIAPANPGQPRIVKVTTVPGSVIDGANRPRIMSIRDPHGTTINLNYLGSNDPNSGAYRINGRADRFGRWTSYGYDASQHISWISANSEPSQSIVSLLRTAESAGDAWIGTAVPLDSVYTRHDGPRTDVADVTKWWVNRFGAPVRSQDPVGIESRIVYDATWPALPAEVTDAAGVRTRAFYNARGLVDSTVVYAPLGAAAGNAVTRVTWNPNWEMPSQITDPNGVTTTRTYDGSGNLTSEYVGPNPARATLIFYHGGTSLPYAIHEPGSGLGTSFDYDAELGNVRRVLSPLGVAKWLYKDAIGRDTLVRQPVDTVAGLGQNWQEQRLTYDAAGLVWQALATAPAMPYSTVYAPLDPVAVNAESLFVRTTYDLEGRPATIHAFSRPNVASWQVCDAPVGKCAGVPPGTVGSYDIRTYDWIGRPLTQRLGSGPAQVTYDPAGNVVSEVSRNGHTIVSVYDAANRLVRRIVPSVTHQPEGCENYPEGMGKPGAPNPNCFMKFPYYPTGTGPALVIPADTARFVFDDAGRMVRADNRDARVSRSYYPGGALRTDTLRIRNYGSSQFTTSVFGSTYTYDIGGRRISHALPTNYALADGTISYAYEATTGWLQEVAQGTSRIRFTYDSAGRQDSLKISKNVAGAETLGVIERRQYDAEGQLSQLSRLRREGANFTGLLSNTLHYDSRGKVRRAEISSAASEVGVQTARNAYAGLGAVVASERWNAIGWDAEQFRTSAMGEVYRSRSDAGSQMARHPMVAAFDLHGALVSKMAVPPSPDPYYTDTAYTQVDNAGNLIRSGAIFNYYVQASARYYTAARNYYGADNRLVVAQRYHFTDGGRSGAWEEFRYDALGRRILSRSRRGTDDALRALCAGGGCVAYIERTIWDGDQVLYELRSDGAEGLSAAQLEQSVGSGLHWGKAGYVHAGGIDKPLVTMDGRVPTYNWRGLPESSVWTDGTKADYSLGSCSGNCVLVSWPASNSIYLKPPPPGSSGNGGATPQWIGTVLADGAGSTGLLYRRNRFYDPGTGQFTQQDPIGLAGGLNVYGFANGDPINFSDPFGLKADTLEAVTVSQTSTELPTTANRSVCVDKSVAASTRSIFADATAAGIPVTLNNAYRGGVQAGTGGRPAAGAGSPHRAGFAFDINSSALTATQLADFTRIAGTYGFDALAGDPGHYSARRGAATVYGSHEAGVTEADRSYGAGECADAQEAATPRNPN